MTVGSLLGEKGRQWPEWRRLVNWIGTEVKLYAWTRIECRAPAISLTIRSVHLPPGVKHTCGGACSATAGVAASRRIARIEMLRMR